MDTLGFRQMYLDRAAIRPLCQQMTCAHNGSTMTSTLNLIPRPGHAIPVAGGMRV